MQTFRSPDTLVELIQSAATRFPTRGVRYLDPASGGDRFVSYAELYRQAKRLLCGLRAEGVKLSDRVVIQIAEPRLALPLFWACVLGGFVPMFADENALTEARWVLGSAWVITPELAQTLRIENEAIQLTAPLPQETALLAISGHRVAMLTHRSLLSAARVINRARKHGESDVTFCGLPLRDALVDWHIRPMLLGNDAIYSPTSEGWPALMNRYSATHAPIPLDTTDAGAEIAQVSLSHVGGLVLHGTEISEDAVGRLETLLKRCGAPAGVLLAPYGTVEVGGAVTDSGPLRFVEHEDGRFVDRGPAAPGVSLRVGVNGAIEMRGDVCFGGYLGEPKATAAVFSSDGWVRTGDAGFLHEGRLLVTGKVSAAKKAEAAPVAAPRTAAAPSR